MKKHLHKIIIALLSVVFIVSAFNIISYYLEATKQNKIYSVLADTTTDIKQEEPTVETPSDEPLILSKYKAAYGQNTDMVGWIKIDDTKINYPVMLSIDSPDFYLTHGFDKKYTVYGCPYIKEDCDVFTPSDNVVIYGHNMKNGTMFADLKRYRDKSFFETHKTITFDTIYKSQKFMILAAFETEVNTNSTNLFEYYDFINAKTAEEFTEYIEKCKELSFYDTGTTANFGDKLITLSTCTDNDQNKRIVVVACSIN